MRSSTVGLGTATLAATVAGVGLALAVLTVGVGMATDRAMVAGLTVVLAPVPKGTLTLTATVAGVAVASGTYRLASHSMPVWTPRLTF